MTSLASQQIYLFNNLMAPVTDGLVATGSYSAGTLALNGTFNSTPSGSPYIANNVYTNPDPQYLIITCSGNESANTFTFVGTDNAPTPNTFTYSVAGANAGTVVVPVPFYQIKSGSGASGIQIANATSGNIKIGITNQTATPWVALDTSSAANTASLQVTISSGASLTYSIQATLEDPTQGDVLTSSQMVNDLTLVNKTVTGVTSYTSATGMAKYIRMYISSWTSGTAKLIVIQSGTVE